jgi:hypothetical protein
MVLGKYLRKCSILMWMGSNVGREINRRQKVSLVMITLQYLVTCQTLTYCPNDNNLDNFELAQCLLLFLHLSDHLFAHSRRQISYTYNFESKTEYGGLTYQYHLPCELHTPCRVRCQEFEKTFDFSARAKDHRGKFSHFRRNIPKTQ